MPAIRNSSRPSSYAHPTLKSQPGPVTRSQTRTLGQYIHLVSPQLPPSIPPASPTLSDSSLYNPRSAASTEGDGEESEAEDCDNTHLNLSPNPVPPTSPAPSTQFDYSPMSVVTPRQLNRTRFTTPETPTPMVRAGGTTLRRTYAMVFSPAMQLQAPVQPSTPEQQSPPAPQSPMQPSSPALMDVDPDEDRTPRARAGM